MIGAENGTQGFYTCTCSNTTPHIRTPHFLPLTHTHTIPPHTYNTHVPYILTHTHLSYIPHTLTQTYHTHLPHSHMTYTLSHRHSDITHTCHTHIPYTLTDIHTHHTHTCSHPPTPLFAGGFCALALRHITSEFQLAPTFVLPGFIDHGQPSPFCHRLCL